MKYQMYKLPKNQFEPFMLTLEFETHEEYKYFHDNVLKVLIRGGTHPFVGHFYQMGKDNIDDAEGCVDLVEVLGEPR